MDLKTVLSESKHIKTNSYDCEGSDGKFSQRRKKPPLRERKLVASNWVPKCKSTELQPELQPELWRLDVTWWRYFSLLGRRSGIMAPSQGPRTIAHSLQEQRVAGSLGLKLSTRQVIATRTPPGTEQT